ncbi:MAG: glycosyltransferase [Chloroflexota bacterium]
MKITVLAAGSRGDIQPYLAFSVGLQKAGYQVCLAANSNFSALAKQYDIPFFPLQIDSYAFTQDPRARAWLESRNPLKLAFESVRIIQPMVAQLLKDAWVAAQDADAIVYHSYAMPTGYYIGKQLGIPTLPISMYPLPTRAHRALPIELLFPMGGWGNLASHWIVDYFTWQVYRPSAQKLFRGQQRVRRTTPYQALYREKRPLICCYSPSAFPKPDDVPDHVNVLGYFFLDPPSDWQPSAELSQFLAAGPPPVYVGFGSMGDPAKADETTEMVLAALAKTGQRGLLASGWSGLGKEKAMPDNVFVLDGAPHTWLMPQMAANIHHGGVGTTGAALRAGVPNAVVPHFGDQPFWGEQVAKLGVGPGPIHRKQLTVDKLAKMVETAVSNPTMRHRAATLGQQIQTEDGIAQSIKLFEQYLANSQ